MWRFIGVLSVVCLIGYGARDRDSIKNAPSSRPESIRSSTIIKVSARETADESLWADKTSVYPKLEDSVRKSRPAAEKCEFDERTFEVKQLPGQQLKIGADTIEVVGLKIQVTGMVKSQGDQAKQPRLCWEAEASLHDGAWDVGNIRWKE